MATAAVAARHICLSASRFRDLVSAGVFERQPSGKYDLTTIREAYCLHMQKIAAGRGDDGNGALSKQRARLAKAQTRSATLKTEILAGQFVSLDAIGRRLDGLFAVMREIALTMPGKVSDAVAAHTKEDRAAVFEIIDGEVREMLTRMSVAEVLEPRKVSAAEQRRISEEIACAE
jgi:hypothetical protein